MRPPRPQYAPGLLFDARSVVLGVTGLFFGTMATVPAMSMAVAYRFSQGGTGTLTGVLVIASSGAVGLLWRHLRGGVDHQMRWGTHTSSLRGARRHGAEGRGGGAEEAG